MIGEIQQWETEQQDGVSRVSLSLRMIDVETGLLLFKGEGFVTDATDDDPETLARKIVHRVLTRFGAKTGILGSGRIGVNWELREEAGSHYCLVREIRSGSPAEQAGLRVGDMVVSCNGSSLAQVNNEREAKQLCRVAAGQTLSLEVRRGNQHVLIVATAEKTRGTVGLPRREIVFTVRRGAPEVVMRPASYYLRKEEHYATTSSGR